MSDTSSPRQVGQHELSRQTFLRGLGATLAAGLGIALLPEAAKAQSRGTRQPPPPCVGPICSPYHSCTHHCGTGCSYWSCKCPGQPAFLECFCNKPCNSSFCDQGQSCS